MSLVTSDALEKNLVLDDAVFNNLRELLDESDREANQANLEKMVEKQISDRKARYEQDVSGVTYYFPSLDNI